MGGRSATRGAACGSTRLLGQLANEQNNRGMCLALQASPRRKISGPC